MGVCDPQNHMIIQITNPIIDSELFNLFVQFSAANHYYLSNKKNLKCNIIHFMNNLKCKFYTLFLLCIYKPFIIHDEIRETEFHV